jgi:hypothetical protein
MNSACLCSQAGRYDNPIHARFLAPIDFLKIPALNPTPLFRDFKDAKKLIFSSYFFLITYPQARTLSSVLKIKVFAKNFVLKPLYFPYYFRKGKKVFGSGSLPLTDGSGFWRPKNMRILRIRFPNTVINIFPYTG